MSNPQNLALFHDQITSKLVTGIQAEHLARASRPGF